MKKLFWSSLSLSIVALVCSGLALVSVHNSLPSSPELKAEPKILEEYKSVAIYHGAFVCKTPFVGKGVPTAHCDYFVEVRLESTDLVIPDRLYIADLYEKGVYRDSAEVSWNEYEVNVHDWNYIDFCSNTEEYEAYFMKNVDDIFSVKVRPK